MSTKLERKILFVDDEANILQGYKRSLRKHFSVHTAVGGEEALSVLEAEGPFAVVVSDFKMPEMNGVQLLSKVREHAPDTIRVMLTGQAEMDAAIGAINDGKIFRFLTKPCPAEQLSDILEECLEQYRLIHAEKELLENTLSGSASVLVEILSLVNPVAFSRSSRLRRYTEHVAKKLKVPNLWEFQLAGLLSQIGCVSLPKELVQKYTLNEGLTGEEQALFSRHPKIAEELLCKIPRLEAVSKMVGNQMRPLNNYNEDELETDAALGGQVLRAILDFDQMYQGGKNLDEAFQALKHEAGSIYNPKVIETLTSVDLTKAQKVLKKVNIMELTTDMVFAEDVHAISGVLLIAKGQQVSHTIVTHLHAFAKRKDVEEPLLVECVS